jgi:predicted O-linked N-acetylglucosamine transferase (SPINDLY family)
VLIYPEIGMDPMTAKLANLRLAPVQATTWGHPETSGLPTIDYYFSAADFEPEEAKDNYTEELVLLPNLGCCYSPLQLNPCDLSLRELGIDTTVPLLICPGTPFKYAPQHDRVYVEIARRLGRCQFIFFGYRHKGFSDQLTQRLVDAFTDAGLDFHRFGIVVPWLKPTEFHSLMRQADVYLDTIGFSGFNTAMQAVECGLPIVAKDGRFMRGRFASGILRRLGVTELIARSGQEYVDLAVQLAQNRTLRLGLRDRISESRQAVFNDVAPIRALEEFLATVANR